jgi:Clostripain family
MAKTTSKESAAQSVKPRPWTVMVYMAADNDAALDAIAVRDIREMERGANGDADVVVQINRAWPDSFQCYEIRKAKNGQRLGQSVLIRPDDDTNDTADDTSNMGKADSLTQFLEWAVVKYPAHRYFLVLWGHSYGLGFGRDHGDALTMKELKTALERFREKRLGVIKKYDELATEPASDGRLDLLGANACAMSYVESAYELKDSAQYMVASQISVPFAGWPYESILKRIGRDSTAADLGRLVVDTYVSHFNGLIGGERVAMSLLNLGAAEPLKDLLKRLAAEIKGEAIVDGKFSSPRLDFVRDIFLGAAVGDVRPLLDLRDLCQDFSDAESDELKKVASEIDAALETLVEHHDEHSELDDLNGIGVFAPFVTDERDLRQLQLQDFATNGNGNHSSAKLGRTAYEELDIFDGTKAWPRLVYDELRKEISPEILTCITSIDATRPQDRRDVTQIILAIDSAFNKLDRVLAAARLHIDGTLKGKNGHGRVSGEPVNPVPHPFGPPFLRLIQPPSLETEVEVLKQRLTLDLLRKVASGEAAIGAAEYLSLLGLAGSTSLPPSGSQPTPIPQNGGNPALVNKVVDFFGKVERAIGEVERATRRGLTHAKLGLGPASPNLFNVQDGGNGFGIEDPKSGLGIEDPKSGLGIEDPKSGLGELSNGGLSASVRGGDLRVDMALARVTDLFRQVGQTLRELEQAALQTETTARAMLADPQTQKLNPKDLVAAAAQEIGRAFRLLEESSTNARRTVRRVLSHPVYGLGPGSTGLGLEERQALASAGGLDRRSLRLL